MNFSDYWITVFFTSIFLGPLAGAASVEPSPAVVRHAISLTGTIDGSVQQLLGENVSLAGEARLTGDLLVPGTPTVRLNGKPDYAGTLDDSGAVLPSNYRITLSGEVKVRHVVRRTDPVAMPAVVAPAAPTGTRSVILNKAGQSPGDFATLRNLTLTGDAGQFALPPGKYGIVTANGESGVTLGVAGSLQQQSK